MLGRMSVADKQRLDRHFEELSALEKRINQAPVTASRSCRRTMDPGEDPQICPSA